MTKTSLSNSNPPRSDEAGYDLALRRIESLRSTRALNPPELCERARLILLSSGAILELKDAEISLMEALEQDSGYVPAMIELGHFYDAVMGDGEKAREWFEKAVLTTRTLLTESVKGLFGCLQSLEDPLAAAERLRGTHRSALRLELLEREERNALGPEPVVSEELLGGTDASSHS